jgi:heme oxygenase
MTRLVWHRRAFIVHRAGTGQLDRTYVFEVTDLGRENEVCSGQPAAMDRGLLSRLEVATRQWHGGVEATWRALGEHSVTRADYLAALLRTYGFVAPLESACRYTPGLARLLETRPLTRAGLLAQDLLTLGVQPARLAALPQCRWITTFKDVPEALGWLYVAYRAAVVQSGVHRQLIARLPELEDACAYLASGETSFAWDAYQRTIERYGAQPDSGNEVVAAASEAFACADRWDDEQELERWRITG